MEPPSLYSISILNSSGRRAPRALPLRAAEATLLRHRMPAGALSILFTTSEHQTELNRTFRGLDCDTDVLTFPAAPIPDGSGPTPLGDLSISMPFAAAQATHRGLKLEHELAHLVIHGVLHLAGFDDEDDASRQAMQVEMAQIAASLSIPIDAEWESALYAAEGRST